MHIVNAEPLESDIIEEQVSLYYKETKLDIIEVNIEFTSDILLRKLELESCEKIKEDILNNKDFISGLNGTIVLPTKTCNTSFILLSNKAKDNFQYVSTVIHELTHVHDYCELIKRKDMKFFPNSEFGFEDSMIYFWSEYNATRYGYRYLRTFILRLTQRSLLEQFEHILNVEYPIQTDLFFKNLVSYKNDPTLCLYTIMRYLGRYSIWNELFPSYINENSLPRCINEVPIVHLQELYSFLKRKSSFSEIWDNMYKFNILLNSCVK